MNKVLFFLLMMMTMKAFAETTQFPDSFFFGVANAPAQVEDQLEDTWVEWGRNGKIPDFLNTPFPEDRIRFWTEPEREIALAKELGIQVFRLGVDWQRIFPFENQINFEAIARYQEILKLIRASGMKVMLTLFHHAEPDWLLNKGSWTNKASVIHFEDFSRVVVENFGDQVDYWITFNEANVYALMTQIANSWPNPTLRPHPLSLFNLGPIKGNFSKSLINMARAHEKAHKLIKKSFPQSMVGIAQNIADYRGKNFLNSPFALLSWNKFNYQFMDLVGENIDFHGVNYYGAEILSGTKIIFSDKYEYSDSGRAVSPFGLYHTLTKLNKRFTKRGIKRPFIITENGVADQDGWLRSSYIIEHLRATKKAMDDGVDVLGYIAWSLSDNLEWSDGYCPKFGMVAVDRANNMNRIKRPGFFTYQEIIKSKLITSEMRNRSWQRVLDQAGKPRAMCRSKDGVTPLKSPRMIPAKQLDWRFQ